MDSIAPEASFSKGHVYWYLRSDSGLVVAQGECHNLITQVGDQADAERAAGVSGALAGPTGMKLGTGATAPAKTGAGAALTTYLSDSHQAFDATYPSSALNGAARRIVFQTTWAAGKATSTSAAITEAVIVNDTLANATSTAANTLRRVLLAGIPSKAVSESLTLVWPWDLQGS